MSGSLFGYHNHVSRYFLGVDGGQSSTSAYIADETGRFLGGGTSGPCNHVRGEAGREKFTSAVLGSLKVACQVAELDPSAIEFEAACLGFSGGADDKREMVAELGHTDRLLVTDDASVALLGATGGKPGIITIAGTGSISHGRNAAGKTARAGGWGYLFGDEGGALDLARQALRAALRFEEGWGPPTELHSALLRAAKATDANTLMHRFYTRGYPRSKIARSAPLVDKTAMQGDEVARELLNNAAQQLASITSGVRQQLFRVTEPAAVAYVGGVFESAILRERFRVLVEFEEGNKVQPPLYDPAAGALIGAFRLVGYEPELRHLPEPD